MSLTNGNDVLLYLVDLSASFDWLRKDIFFKTLKDTINLDLRNIIIDFLSERKITVEIDGENSSVKSLPLGFVQGSI